MSESSELTFKEKFRRKFPSNTIIKVGNTRELLIRHRNNSFYIIDLDQIRNEDFSIQMVFKYNSDKAQVLFNEGAVENPGKILFYLGSTNIFVLKAIEKIQNARKSRRKN